MGLLAAAACKGPVQPTQAEAAAAEALKACGLPADYEPPWGSDAIPEEERVPGALAFGAIPLIGCPPAPPGPGEPDVRVIEYRLEGSPYKEPNRRMVLAQLATVRDCYRGQGKLVTNVALTIARDGTVSEAHTEGLTGATTLQTCVETALRSLRFHGGPSDTPSQLSFRLRVAD